MKIQHLRPFALTSALLAALALGAGLPTRAQPGLDPGASLQEPEHDHDGDGQPDHESHPEETPLPVPVPDTGPRPGKPRLDVDQAEHDFGAAIEGERLTHVFKLKSSTAKPTW